MISNWNTSCPRASTTRSELAQGWGVADSVPEAMDAYAVADARGAIVGVAGLEFHGHFALLCAVAVSKAHRQNGFGAQRIDLPMQSRPSAIGIYLLRTIAVNYFARRGFTVVHRVHV